MYKRQGIVRVEGARRLDDPRLDGGAGGREAEALQAGREAGEEADGDHLADPTHVERERCCGAGQRGLGGSEDERRGALEAAARATEGGGDEVLALVFRGDHEAGAVGAQGLEKDLEALDLLGCAAPRCEGALEREGQAGRGLGGDAAGLDLHALAHPGGRGIEGEEGGGSELQAERDGGRRGLGARNGRAGHGEVPVEGAGLELAQGYRDAGLGEVAIQGSHREGRARRGGGGGACAQRRVGARPARGAGALARLEEARAPQEHAAAVKEGAARGGVEARRQGVGELDRKGGGLGGAGAEDTQLDREGALFELGGGLGAPGEGAGEAGDIGEGNPSGQSCDL